MGSKGSVLANLPVGQASPDQVFGTGSGSGLPSGGGGGEIMQALTGGLGSPVQVTDADIRAAITPISGRGPQQMPSFFTTPHSQVLPPAQMMDNSQTVGAGNARGRAIGNTVSSVSRLTGNIVAQKKLQKQEADATKVQRLLEAQAGIDQAQSILKQDPNNAEAKQSLQENQRLVQGMFQDPKFVKTLEKGFQISLTDPSQNKTEDHNIIQRGIDLFKKKSNQSFSTQQAQGMMQKFQQNLPKQLMPNVQAQQALQMKMAQQQMQASLFKDRLTYMGKLAEAEGRVDAAKLQAYSRIQSELIISQREFDKEAARRANEFDLAKYKAGLEEDVAQFKYNLDNKDAKSAIKDYDDAVKNYTTQRDQIVGRVAEITKQMQDPNLKIDQKRMSELQTELDSLHQTEKILGDNFEAHRKMMLANLNLVDPQATLAVPPPPQVGAGASSGGGTNAGSTSKQQSESGGGINPITGHPWHKSTPPIDRLITEGLFNLNKVAGGASGGASSFEEWLKSLPGKIKGELTPRDDEDRPD